MFLSCYKIQEIIFVNHHVKFYFTQAFLNGNFEDLNDDTRSVISKASVFSKGYYRAPRNNFNKNKLFEDNEAERNKVEKKGIGRTVTSEYNYDDKKVFSKINKKKNHNEDSQSQLSRADRLNGPPQVNKLLIISIQKLTNKEGKKTNNEENEVPIDKIDENVNGENQIEGEGDEEYNSEVSDFVPEDPKDDISDNSLESIDTPKHISDDRTQQEIQSDIKSEKRERMKAKAKRILEKMNNNSVCLSIMLFYRKQQCHRNLTLKVFKIEKIGNIILASLSQFMKILNTINRT